RKLCSPSAVHLHRQICSYSSILLSRRDCRHVRDRIRSFESLLHQAIYRDSRQKGCTRSSLKEIVAGSSTIRSLNDHDSRQILFRSLFWRRSEERRVGKECSDERGEES